MGRLVVLTYREPGDEGSPAVLRLLYGEVAAKQLRYAVRACQAERDEHAPTAEKVWKASGMTETDCARSPSTSSMTK